MDAPNVRDEQQIRSGLAWFAGRAGRLLLAVIVLSLPLATVPTSIAGEPPKPDQVIDGFLETCGENDWLNEQQRKKVLEIVATLRKDRLSADAVITEALREACPDFAAALDALSEKVRRICDQAIRTAVQNERKTIMDRDVP